MSKKIFALIGAPGSGKGSFSSIVKKVSPNSTVLSSSGVLKNSGIVLGKGELIPDKKVIPILMHEIKQLSSKIIFLDGFPRTVSQFEILMENTDISGIIHISTPEDILLKRILDRQVCSNCGASYTTLSTIKQPKVNGICDECDGKLIHREDDSEKAFITRLSQYQDNTLPIIEEAYCSGIDVYELNCSNLLTEEKVRNLLHELEI